MMEALHGVIEREYGLRGALSRLGGSGGSWLLLTEDGYRAVVKSACGASPDEVALERRAADVAAAAGLGVPWPRTRLTRSGAHEAPVASAEGATDRVRVIDFVPGTPWIEAGPASPARRRALGRLLGSLDRAFARAGAGGLGPRTHDWDLVRAGQHRSKVVHVPDPAHRRLLESAFLLHAGAVARLDTLPTEHVHLIHGDVNDENVLVDGDRIAGIVDFGDCLVAPVVCELAIALAYAMLDEPAPLEVGAELAGAFHAEYALTAEELELIFPLVCGRLATTVAIAADRRRTTPEHPTWYVTEARAWRLLERLTAIAPVDAARALARETGVAVFTDRGAPAVDLLARRHARLSRALSVSYREPLKMIRGRAQFLYDEGDRPFLDLVNNVCHVGHCHPRVVRAGAEQMARLNTNTRYLSDLVVEYAERLCATLPAPLDTCLFVNSGSEANELALRIATTVTGRREVVVVDGAYHGNTRGLIAVSPYKFLGRGGSGRAEPWVHVVPLPDAYRGRHRGTGADVGRAYAADVRSVLRGMDAPPAAFLTESIQSCGGQIVPPPGYLRDAFAAVRDAGGLCIADEVQTGFGRVGRAFWAFELQDAVPDIVVLGKPMGNGHPMGAVVMTSAVARAFENGMEFFSSFGGNPVSSAIGLAVLDVIRDEGLQAHAAVMGARFMDGLRALRASHPIVGDVRGEGLFIGVELVTSPAQRTPAAAGADALVNRLRARGVLASTDGPDHNVIKIKPPLVIQSEDVDLALRLFDEELP
jgi:4-aminobutyrate aminotransferase-like enzyme/Ser/Thr protein kinase RdoA (MazF antagonist)